MRVVLLRVLLIEMTSGIGHAWSRVARESNLSVDPIDRDIVEPERAEDDLA